MSMQCYFTPRLVMYYIEFVDKKEYNCAYINKKNFVGSLGFCSVHYNGMLNKMAAIANIGNLNFDEITL